MDLKIFQLERGMTILFWLCALFTVFTYLGYPIWLWIFSRLRYRPVIKRQLTPTVTIIIAVRNEEGTLSSKLDCLRGLEYPRDRIQIVVASNGSTDGTERILHEHCDYVDAVILKTACGKAAALNEAVTRAKGEILVFMDARQSVDSNAVSELTACFGDPDVGAVSGELLLDSHSGSSSGGLGIYWEIEKAVRKFESDSGSEVGVTGALYAMRRELYVPIPAGTILDDVFVPMNVVRLGKRVIFQPKAIARDRVFSEEGKEFSRKVRTLTGNYQLTWLMPWLLSWRNPLLFRYVCHKLLRLLCPLLLVLMLVSAGMAEGQIYQAFFCSQILFYALGAFGILFPSTNKFKPVKITATFVMLNAAATLAFCNFITGRNRVWL